MSKKTKIYFSAVLSAVFIFIVIVIIQWKNIERKIPDVMGIGFILPWEDAQEYELLVKKVQTGSGAGAYQPGDIVAIKPAGYQWSAGERNNFDIVKIILTPRQAEELLRPKEPWGKGEENMPVIEARRKYYIQAGQAEDKNLEKLSVSVEEVQKR